MNPGNILQFEVDISCLDWKLKLDIKRNQHKIAKANGQIFVGCFITFVSD